MIDACPSCGEPVSKTNRFCGVCGFDLQPSREQNQTEAPGHEASRRPTTPSTQPPRKATVIGMSPTFPDIEGASESIGDGHRLTSTSAAAATTGTSSTSVKRVPRKTMIGIPLSTAADEAVGQPSEAGVPDHLPVYPDPADLDQGLDADASAGGRREAPVSYRPRANVRYEEGFEPIGDVRRRKQLFRVWGVLLGLSIGWLLFRYLATHG